MLKNYYKLIIILTVPLLLVIGHQKMKACRLSDEDGVVTEEDKLPIISLAPKEVPVTIDTASQRILFFGDSMLEGLSKRFSDYAVKNGHYLKSVIWYSSSTQVWATHLETLRKFVKEVNPTFIVICCGSNELFVRDLDKRDKYIKTIVNEMGSTPYVWIGPPNWTKDTGIDSLILKNVGPKRYFDSASLTLSRGNDHRHPTWAAASIWMDQVAVWMSDPKKTMHPIKMEYPEFKGSKNNATLLAPPK